MDESQLLRLPPTLNFSKAGDFGAALWGDTAIRSDERSIEV